MAALGALPRRLLLSFFVADDTLQIVELHEGSSGSQVKPGEAKWEVKWGSEVGSQMEPIQVKPSERSEVRSEVGSEVGSQVEPPSLEGSP